MNNLDCTLTKAILASLAFISLQACAPTVATPPSSVAAAYESSNIIAIKPYTRTIFSTNDF